MPRLHTYDYAIVRVVPRVDRGEFVNAGVVVACASSGYLKAFIELDEARRVLPPIHDALVADRPGFIRLFY